MTLISRTCFCFSLSAWLASQAFAVGDTPLLYNVRGAAIYEYLGYAVSGAGDVNADGYSDVIIGAYQGRNNGVTTGTAQVLSGHDGSQLYLFAGDSTGDRFGYALSDAGDVNGDGYADVIVGAYQDDNTASNAGSAKVFSGQNGSVLHTFNGDSANDGFGYAVSGAGDVDNDGYDDVIVGAYNDDNTGFDAGSARVFSGVDGSTLYTFNGDGEGDYFGRAVSGAGDINKDGYDDLLVGASADNTAYSNMGSARVFSGIDGSTLYYLNGNTVHENFGISVSDAGDVNGDGYPDLIVGANLDDNNGYYNSGSAYIFSGANTVPYLLDVLYVLNGESPEDQFGISVSGAGDVNQDGYADVIVGATWDDGNAAYAGSARVFSGVDGNILYTFYGDAYNDQSGSSVAAAGDVNGDSYADLIVGGYLNDGVTFDTGIARIFSGKGLWVDGDADGQNDALDTDDDNDTVLDLSDNTPRGDGVDTDGDGMLNAFDGDDDNDGVTDAIDEGPLDVGNVNEIVLPLNSLYKGLIHDRTVH